ncbi:unnamed protein product [Nesidiocoris tenuis]|uniref:Uncharacterized protein n=1 Tax=Nesidiocoris tenuis TaxID=355587 RepID=A0A6H5H4D1_9HEMI|nr:unnamed protein product [Nesidiocoris tenuis]
MLFRTSCKSAGSMTSSTTEMMFFPRGLRIQRPPLSNIPELQNNTYSQYSNKTLSKMLKNSPVNYHHAGTSFSRVLFSSMDRCSSRLQGTISGIVKYIEDQTLVVLDEIEKNNILIRQKSDNFPTLSRGHDRIESSNQERLLRKSVRPKAHINDTSLSYKRIGIK